MSDSYTDNLILIVGKAHGLNSNSSYYMPKSHFYAFTCWNSSMDGWIVSAIIICLIHMPLFLICMFKILHMLNMIWFLCL